MDACASLCLFLAQKNVFFLQIVAIKFQLVYAYGMKQLVPQSITLCTNSLYIIKYCLKHVILCYVLVFMCVLMQKKRLKLQEKTIYYEIIVTLATSRKIESWHPTNADVLIIIIH